MTINTTKIKIIVGISFIILKYLDDLVLVPFLMNKDIFQDTHGKSTKELPKPISTVTIIEKKFLFHLNGLK